MHTVMPRSRWERSLVYGGSEPLTVSGNRVITSYVDSNRSAVVSVDVSTGASVWEYPVKHRRSSATASPLVLGSSLLVNSYDDVIIVDARSGRELRRGMLPDGNYVTASPAAWRDLLLLPTASGRLVAVQSLDLSVAWEDVRYCGNLDAGPVVSDDCVYLSANDQVRCLDAASGRLVWTSSNPVLPMPFVHGPTVLSDRLLVPAGWRDGRVLVAVSKTDGSLIWTADLGRTAPEHKIYYGFDSRCVILRDMAMVGSPDGGLYAISVNDGQVQWRIDTSGPILAPPLLLGDTLLFGSNDGYLRAAEAATGKVLWALPVGGEVWNSPAYIGGTVVLAISRRHAAGGGEGLLCAFSLDGHCSQTEP